MRWQLIKLVLRLLFTLLFRKDISPVNAAFNKGPAAAPQTTPPVAPLAYDVMKSRLMRGGPIVLAMVLTASTAFAGGSFNAYDATTRINKRITGGDGIDITSAGAIRATGVPAGGVSAVTFNAYTSAQSNLNAAQDAAISAAAGVAGSALQPNGSGASLTGVVKTANQKVLNALEQGVLCGTQNESSSIQALLNMAQSGDTLYFPKCTAGYGHKTQLVLPRDIPIRIIGDGPAATIFKAYSTMTSQFYKEASPTVVVQRPEFSDIGFDCNKKAASAMIFEAYKGAKVSRIYINDWTYKAAVFGKTTGSTGLNLFYEAVVDNVSAYLNTNLWPDQSLRPDTGIEFARTASDNHISNIIVAYAKLYGIRDDSVHNQYNKLHLWGTASYPMNYGMYVNYKTNIDQFYGDGIAVAGVKIRDWGGHVNISDGYFFDMPVGVELPASNAPNVSISGTFDETVTPYSGTPDTGFYFQGNGIIRSDSVTVDTEAYDATGWNGDLSVPTKDAVRDKIESLAPAGATTFLSLTDTPSDYAGQGGKVVQVNAGGTALEFATPSSSETQTTILGKIDDASDTAILTVQAATSTGDSGRRLVVKDSTGGTRFFVQGDGSFNHTRKSAITNFVQTAGSYSAITSGAMATGFGIGHDYFAQDSDAIDRTWGRLAFTRDGVDASTKYQIFGARNGSLTNPINITARGAIGVNADGTGAALEVKPEGFNRVYTYNGSSYTERTTEAGTSEGTPFAVLPVTADHVYMGANFAANNPQSGTAYIKIGTAATGLALVGEYWNGSAWTALTLTDGTSNLAQSGVISFTVPTDWATSNQPGVTRYWWRLRSSADATQTPTIKQLTMFDGDVFAAFAAPGDATPALKVGKEGVITATVPIAGTSASLSTNLTVSGTINNPALIGTTSTTIDTATNALANVTSASVTITNVVANRVASVKFSPAAGGTISISTLTCTWEGAAPAAITAGKSTRIGIIGTGANTADCSVIKENF